MFWQIIIKLYKNLFEEKEIEMKKSMLMSVFLVLAILLTSCGGGAQSWCKRAD